MTSPTTDQLQQRAMEIDVTIKVLNAGIKTLGAELFNDNGGVLVQNVINGLGAELDSIQKQATALKQEAAEEPAEAPAKRKGKK